MVIKKYYKYILIIFIILFIFSTNCLADNFYLSLFYYTFDFGSTGLFPYDGDIFNNLLKQPVPVWMWPWLFGYEKRFSENSIFQHLFEFEVSTSSFFSMPLNYGKADTVWLFYIKYGIGLIRISVENIFYIKIGLYSGLCYGYHYMTYYPLNSEDEKYYKKTFHYFDFFIEPRFSFGILLAKNLYLFYGYSKRISLFYTQSFNPDDRFRIIIYFEYII